MIQRLREVWKELDRSIFWGTRKEKNLRGISFAALFIIVVNLITGTINLLNGYYLTALASGMFIVAAVVILIFAHYRKDRRGAVITALISVIIIFTFEILSVKHGFPVFWTLLLPIGFCYFATVKAGIGLSLYFLILHFALFYTPLRDTLAKHYSDVVASRFPILYLADVIITAYIMVQYHLSVLHQADNAKMLRRAKEEADLANASKSDFLANMSHEIRTPINAVLGMDAMILREGRKADGEENVEALRASLSDICAYAEDIESAGSNLLAIINDILDFSKIEAGRMDIVEGQYHLSSVLNDLSNMNYFKAKENGLDFVIDVDETLPDRLVGDEVRVRQVITNVLSNAVKYTEHGSVALSVHGDLDGPAEAGQRIILKISVEDTGIGIREEDIQKLFDKFQRLDLRQNSTVEGTGLGLAITKSLLDLMGGSIEVKSEYGKGSLFTITVPQTVSSPEPVGDFQARFHTNVKEAKAYRETFQAPDAHILIVDDTKMNLTVAVGLLKNTKMRIDTAGGGKEALELTETVPYDLILMDQRMPMMDGTEALHLIRAQENGSNPETPVICLTADAVIGAKERYMSEGFTDYLTKPIDVHALEQILIRYLPDEKVIRVQSGEPEAEEPRSGESEDGYAPLLRAGISPESGLGYCQGSADLYRSLLREYADGAEEKEREIRRYFDAHDWKNYSVLVHALKSSSKMIGAAALSGVAAEMEKAADVEAVSAVLAGHEPMLELYARTVSMIQKWIGAADAAGASSPASEEEEEILEFLPEDV